MQVRCLSGLGLLLQFAVVPVAESGQDNNAKQGEQGKPEDISLAASADHEGHEQWPERRAKVSSDLKKRLGESVPTARCQASEARGAWMKDRRSHAG